MSLNACAIPRFNLSSSNFHYEEIILIFVAEFIINKSSNNGQRETVVHPFFFLPLCLALYPLCLSLICRSCLAAIDFSLRQAQPWILAFFDFVSRA